MEGEVWKGCRPKVLQENMDVYAMGLCRRCMCRRVLVGATVRMMC